MMRTMRAVPTRAASRLLGVKTVAIPTARATALKPPIGRTRCRNRARIQGKVAGLFLGYCSAGAPPGLGREALKLGKIGLVRVVGLIRFSVGLVHEIMHVTDKHEADGVQGVVPV